MRIFFDTNVLLSAFTHPGVCSRLVFTAIDEHQVYSSEYVIEEVHRTLINTFSLPLIEADEWSDWIREHTVIVPVSPLVSIDLRDPTDLPILTAAVYARSDILCSGDKDLLELANPPIRILSPRALHDMIVPKKS